MERSQFYAFRACGGGKYFITGAAQELLDQPVPYYLVVNKKY